MAFDHAIVCLGGGGGGGRSTPYIVLHREAPPTFFSIWKGREFTRWSKQRVGKSVSLVCKMTFKSYQSI